MDELRCALEWRADDSRQSPGRLIGRLIEYGNCPGRLICRNYPGTPILS